MGGLVLEYWTPMPEDPGSNPARDTSSFSSVSLAVGEPGIPGVSLSLPSSNWLPIRRSGKTSGG